MTKPILSPAQQATQLAFCHAHYEYDWESVIFTDESYFETGNLHHHQACSILC
ncbi:hypothetical protein L873DRAFT_682680 [Choiromyces venosus 120613-1]|uniref:Uncharacterized protein n=1 Tax=Choiromyces venosus 120613-1 TaxID=1336337 RepID=A0A3N4IWR3_9PEZI|nr:hypothetical protein L873DRAFT_682680 [Choiromyces venosus 120613-1]